MVYEAQLPMHGQDLVVGQGRTSKLRCNNSRLLEVQSPCIPLIQDVASFLAVARMRACDDTPRWSLLCNRRSDMVRERSGH